MYKKQLTWQKILCFAAIAAAAILFVYALGVMTDLYDALYSTMMDPDNIESTMVTGSQVYYHMQPFNKDLLVASIGMILLACLLFMTSTHTRRRYYVGNIVSTLAYAAGGLGVSLWCHQQVEFYKAEFLQIDFDELKFFAEMWGSPYIDSTFWFDAHYAVCGLICLVAALLVLNLVWKFVLMGKEQKLIEAGRKVAA